MIADEIFARFARGENPGHLLRQSHPHLLERVGDTTDICKDLWTLYGLARSARTPRILEIGTNDGTSTLAFLKAAAELGGHVTSIDIDEVPVAEALVDHFGLRDHWTFLRGDCHKVLKQLRAEDRQFDLCFIDENHRHVDHAEDVEDCAALLVHDGALLTHDNWCSAIGVDWNKPFGERAELGCSQTARDMLTGDEWFGVVFPFGCNLGIFRRRSSVLAEIDRSLNSAREQGFIR